MLKHKFHFEKQINCRHCAHLNTFVFDIENDYKGNFFNSCDVECENGDSDSDAVGSWSMKYIRDGGGYENNHQSIGKRTNGIGGGDAEEIRREVGHIRNVAAVVAADE